MDNEPDRSARATKDQRSSSSQVSRVEETFLQKIPSDVVLSSLVTLFLAKKLGSVLVVVGDMVCLKIENPQ